MSLSDVCTAKTLYWSISNASLGHPRLTSLIDVCGFSWQFVLHHEMYNQTSTTPEENKLKMYLHRFDKKMDTQFTCIASTSIKLLSFDKKIPSQKKSMVAVEFGAGNPSKYGIPLISIANIMNPANGFIQNDTIHLEIKIKVDPPAKVYPNNLAQLEILPGNEPSIVRLNLKVNDFANRIGVLTPIFNHSKTLWKICVYQNDDMLELYWRPMDKEFFKYAADIGITLKLLSFNQEHAPVSRYKIIKINPDTHVYVFTKFIELRALNDPIAQFVRNGSINLEINFEVIDKHGKVSKIYNGNDICCPICHENLVNLQITTLKCGHMFCQDCVDKGIRPRKKCAVCNAKVVVTQLRRTYLPG